MKNWSWIYRRPNAYIGAGLLCVVLGIAVLGVFYTPYDPLAMDFRARLSSGGEGHMLGTDQFGRDVLSRIMAAAGVSVSVSLLTVVFALFFGIARTLIRLHLPRILKIRRCLLFFGTRHLHS